MTISYPDGLEYHPMNTAFLQKEPHRPALSMEPEDGPDIMRIQSATKLKKFDYAIQFTAAEKIVWDDFVENTLSEGTDQFLMPVPLVNGTYETRRVYLEKGVWQAKQVDILWVVTFTLCVYTNVSV